MSAQENLDAAVVTLATNFASLDAAIQAGVADIAAGLAAKDTTAIQSAADKISAVSAAMAADAAALTAAEAPAPAPAPEPAPATDPAPQTDPASAGSPPAPASGS